MSDHSADDGRAQLLRSIIERICQVVGGDAGALCVLDSRAGRLEMAAGTGRFAGTVGARAQAHWRAGSGGEGRARSDPRTTCETLGCPFEADRADAHRVAIPVRVGDVRGMLCATSVHPAAASLRRDPLLPTLGDLAGSCLDGGRVLELAEQLGALSTRRWIAAEMHDGVAQTMAHLQMQLDTMVDELGGDDPVLGRLVRLRELLGAANDELRTALGTLHRPPDVRCDVGQLLVEMARPASTEPALVSVAVTTRCLVPRSVAEQVRLVAQEAMTNALRHATARQITIHVSRQGPEAVVCVADDGRGFDPDGPAPQGVHLGLGTMRIRASAIHGRIEVRSAPGHGTVVTLRWPA